MKKINILALSTLLFFVSTLALANEKDHSNRSQS